MRNKLLFLLLTLALAGTAFAQKGSRAEKPLTDAPGNEPAGSHNALLSGTTALEAELTSTVDVKKARVGDQVALRTVKAVKQNGETVIPTGSRVIGRITEVARKGKDRGGSRIAMVFDRIEGKTLDAPIEAAIISIVDTRAAVSAADGLAMADASGRGTTAARTSSSGGGLLGGVGSTVGGVVNTTVGTAASVTGSVANTAGSTVGNAGRTLQGLRIEQSAAGSAAAGTAITSPNGTLRLQKGVTFNLLVSGGL